MEADSHRFHMRSSMFFHRLALSLRQWLSWSVERRRDKHYQVMQRLLSTTATSHKERATPPAPSTTAEKPTGDR
jgi:hypothetical protein